MRDAVVLFAKAPKAGNVKTRLGARLGLIAAAELHRAFVHDMAESLASIDADLFIATDDPEAWSETGIPRVLQRGADLGARMQHAASDALAEGRRACAIVGSDAPTLPAEFVGQLLLQDADVSIGPASDGGFYAIACRRVHEAMFAGVNWSTSQTLEETRTALRRAGLHCTLGPPWFDVDEFEDLGRLYRSEMPRYTRRWMEENSALTGLAGAKIHELTP